jgi:hypothetical protein
MFCLTFKSLQISLNTLDMNLGSQSEMTQLSIPINGNTLCRYSSANSNELIFLWHSNRITALVQSWSVIVSIKLHPPDCGNFTIKSIAIVENG